MSEAGAGDRVLRRWGCLAEAPRSGWIAASLLAVFIVSRVAMRALGVRFDGSTIDYNWQFLDPLILREHLGQGLLHLHAQPPGFNLFLGVVLKLFPGREDAAFALALALMGLAAYLGTYGLMRGLGVRRLIAWPAVVMLMISPAAIAYESWLIYDVPVMALLVLAALALQRGGRGDGRPAWLLAFGLLLAALCLTRAMFHLVYPLGIGVVLVLAAGHSPRLRRGLALACGLAALLVAGLFVKNQVLFGRFASSTWMGMNLARVAGHGLSDAERRRLQEQGIVSSLAVVGPFEPLERYPDEYAWTAGFDGVPAVTAAIKSTNATNFNHVGYIEISRQLGRDALAMIRHRPRSYLQGVVGAWYHFFEGASGRNYRRTGVPGWFHHGWSIAVLGRVRAGGYELFMLIIAGTVSGVLYAAWTLLRPTARPALAPDRRLVLWFMLATVVYVALVGNLLDTGENYRFRLYVNPFLLTFLALLLQRVLPGRPAACGDGDQGSESPGSQRPGPQIVSSP